MNNYIEMVEFENETQGGCLKAWLRGWKVPGSILQTTDFMTNCSGQATNAPVSLFTKQY